MNKQQKKLFKAFIIENIKQSLREQPERFLIEEGFWDNITGWLQNLGSGNQQQLQQLRTELQQAQSTAIRNLAQWVIDNFEEDSGNAANSARNLAPGLQTREQSSQQRQQRQQQQQQQQQQQPQQQQQNRSLPNPSR